MGLSNNNQAGEPARILRIGSVVLALTVTGRLAWEGTVIEAGRPPDVPTWHCGHLHARPGDAWPCVDAELTARPVVVPS